MQMATKYQTELALKVILTELNASGHDLTDLMDRAVCRMHKEHLFVKEDSHRERGEAEDILFAYVKNLAGERTCNEKNIQKPTLSIEDF